MTVYKVVRCIVQYGVSYRTVYRAVRCIVPCGVSYSNSLLAISLCGMSSRFIFLVKSKLLNAIDVIVTSHGAWQTGTCCPFGWPVDPLSSIFFINRLNPLSDHSFVGNSDRKRFAPSRLVSYRNFITTLSKAPFTLEINFEINFEIYVNLFLSKEKFLVWTVRFRKK